MTNLLSCAIRESDGMGAGRVKSNSERYTEGSAEEASDSVARYWQNGIAAIKKIKAWTEKRTQRIYY